MASVPGVRSFEITTQEFLKEVFADQRVVNLSEKIIELQNENTKLTRALDEKHNNAPPLPTEEDFWKTLSTYCNPKLFFAGVPLLFMIATLKLPTTIATALVDEIFRNTLVKPCAEIFNVLLASPLAPEVNYGNNPATWLHKIPNCFLLPGLAGNNQISLFGMKIPIGKQKGIPVVDPIFNPTTEEKIKDLAKKLKTSIDTKSYLTNLCLVGPPGTGKTMVAHWLAQYCGIPVRTISYAQIVKEGEHGLRKFQELLDDFVSSSTPKMIFIDEAEQVLLDRNQTEAVALQKATLSAFLATISSANNKGIIVLASNYPDKIDSAAKQRCGCVIQILLPEQPQRGQILNVHMSELEKEKPKKNEPIHPVSKELVEHISKYTKYCSARELRSIAIDLHNLSNTFSGTENEFKEKVDILIHGIMRAVLQDRIRTAYQAKSPNEMKAITNDLERYFRSPEIKAFYDKMSRVNNTNIDESTIYVCRS